MLTSDLSEVKKKKRKKSYKMGYSADTLSYKHKVRDIYEDIKYSPVQFNVEWDEAIRYPEFRKIGKSKWIELAKTGKPINVDNALANKIENTEAGEENRHEFDNLEEPKKERFRKAVEDGTIELPIVARYSDGYLELIAGNTRLTGMMREFGKGKAWIFNVPDEVADLGESSNEDNEITQTQLRQLEDYVDKLWGKLGMDIEFTKHFKDRVNDPRNQKPITMAELVRIFKQQFKKWGKKIAALGPEAQAILKDMRTDVNIPFVLDWDAKDEELNLIAKTIMRKKNFRSSGPEFAVEAKQKYYHGSYDELPIGTVLTPGGDNYESSWGGTPFYGPLEKFRPPEKLAHKEGVFMVGDIDDVDVAGGATDFIYVVEPVGEVQKHDLNWGSEISGLMDDGMQPNDKEVKQAADNYWNGRPHDNEQVWEYLAPRAKIVAVLDDNDQEVTENLNERSAKEISKEKQTVKGDDDEIVAVGGREDLDKTNNPKYQRLMTIGRQKYPYAKSDMEVIASWFHDVDKLAQTREDELESSNKEQDTALSFIELQVSDLDSQIEKLKDEVLKLGKDDKSPKRSVNPFKKESVNEITAGNVGRGTTSKELTDFGPDKTTIAGQLKNGMKVGVEYQGGDLEVSLFGNQKKPTVIGKIDLRKEGATYVSAYSRLSRKYQGQGLGIQLYQFVIKEMGILLKSDLTQSKGSQSVWRKLASTSGIFVYGFRAVPGQKREYFHVAPDSLDQLSGSLEVYDNDEIEQIEDDLIEYENSIMHQQEEGEITLTKAEALKSKARRVAQKEITEFRRAGDFTWLLATSTKKPAKKLKEFSDGRVRAAPVLEEDTPKPKIYVDMDGVLVDFFGEWAKMNNVDNWRDIKDVDTALDGIRKRNDFWINLKPQTSANHLLNAIKKYAGEYYILSSPLSNDPNSEPQKREWVKKHLTGFPPNKVIIHKRKQDYATQKDGTPNILIDDYSEQINNWKSAGGIAIKHKNSNPEKSVQELSQAMTPDSNNADTAKKRTKNQGIIGINKDNQLSKDSDVGLVKGWNKGKAAGNKIKSIAQRAADLGKSQTKRSSTGEGMKIELPPKKKRKNTDRDWSLLKLALEDNIIFEKGEGDCFPVAGRAMIDVDPGMEKAGFKLVHALVQGEGELEGRKFFHAFNMLGDVIFDNSNGNKIMTRKENYFSQGGIDPTIKGGFATYTAEEALINMAKNMHWGPWDLDYSLEENLPDSKREIGKEKLRIAPDELQTIKNELNTEENLKTEWEIFRDGKMARPA